METVKISTITLSTHLPNCQLNLTNIGKYLDIDDEIIGLKADKSTEEKGPNVGAAYIEAFSYIAGALIIYWCV